MKEKLPLVEGGGMPGDEVLHKILSRGVRGHLRLRIRSGVTGSAGHVILQAGDTASSAGIALAWTHSWLSIGTEEGRLGLTSPLGRGFGQAPPARDASCLGSTPPSGDASVSWAEGEPGMSGCPPYSIGSYVVMNEMVPLTHVNTVPSPTRGFHNPEGNGQKPRLKTKQAFHTVFLPDLFMFWVEVCQHFQERQQVDCSIPLTVWFLQISALLFFYNGKEFGNFFYSCNTFFFMTIYKFFLPGVVCLKSNCSWLFISLFCDGTHPPCPIKIKSDGSCQRSAELGWGISFLNLGWGISFLNLQCCCKTFTVPKKTLFERAKRGKSR